ncbi:hypothetical protein Ddc_06208 [Ditylenchus destructor]|nr:hypothetical protein Ddc_06208 [Ditylenchus destructor]
MASKTRPTTRAVAKNRRKREYTPATSDETSSSDLDSEQSNEDHQTIPTPSIDSVLQQFASQANASANDKPSAEIPPQSKQQRVVRPIITSAGGPRAITKEVRVNVPQPMRSFAPVNRGSFPRILSNRQGGQRLGDYSATPPPSNPIRIRPAPFSAPSNRPQPNTLAANLSKVFNTSTNSSQDSQRRPTPILRPSLINARNPRILQDVAIEQTSAIPEESAPFCKSCVNEFPSILKSLDRLDTRINDMLNVMKVAMKKVTGGKVESPNFAVPHRQNINVPRSNGNGTVGPIRVVTRTVLKPRPSQGQTPGKQKVVEEVSLSESDSEPEANLEDVYSRLSALEKEILQISPDKFDAAVLSELSEVIKDTRATKVSSSLDHLVKLGLIKSSQEKVANGSAVTFYRKNMKKFGQLKT